jgi:hypothetical protein
VDTVDGPSSPHFHGDDVEFFDAAGTTRFARIVGIFEDNTVWHKRTTEQTSERTNNDRTYVVVAVIGILYRI